MAFSILESACIDVSIFARHFSLSIIEKAILEDTFLDDYAIRVSSYPLAMWESIFKSTVIDVSIFVRYFSLAMEFSMLKIAFTDDASFSVNLFPFWAMEKAVLIGAFFEGGAILVSHFPVAVGFPILSITAIDDALGRVSHFPVIVFFILNNV